MKKIIKVAPIKTPGLCENCMKSITDWGSKECVDIKCGEPCRRFVKRKPFIKIGEHYVAFFDKNGCQFAYFDDKPEVNN